MVRPIDLVAIAIPPDQRWCILKQKHVGLVPKLKGGSDKKIWDGRKGITTDLNGAYFVDIIATDLSSRKVKIRTKPDSGKKPVPKLDMDVDADLVYPLLKGGKQIRPFDFRPIDTVAIVPNQTITSIPDEKTFKRKYSSTYRYFKRINRTIDNEGNPILEGRSTWKSRMKITGAPFYSVYNIGKYTFAKYKVVWAEMSGTLAAAVVSSQNIKGLGKNIIIPDHKVYFVSTNIADEAHFLCGLLNSEVVRIFVDAFTVKLQVGTLFKHLKLPKYNSKNRFHLKMAALSKEAHQKGITVKLQNKINETAIQITNKM